MSTFDPDQMSALDRELVEDFARSLDDTAEILACSDWTVAEIRMAGRLLASSPDMDDKIRYGRPILAADFERVRRDGRRETARRDEDGAERVVVTRTGFALKVAAAKLYDRAEAFGLWDSAGAPGVFSDSFQRTYPNAMFRPERVEDGRTLYRFK